MTRRSAPVLKVLVLVVPALISLLAPRASATDGCLDFAPYVFAEDVIYVVHSAIHSSEPTTESLVTMHRGKTLLPIRSVPLPDLRRAHSVSRAQDSNSVWITCPPENAVVVLCGRTFEYLDTLSTGDSTFPQGAAPRPDSREMWVTLRDTGQIAVFDIDTTARVATHFIGGRPSVLTFTPDGTKAYAVSGETGEVIVINASTGIATDTISLGGTSLVDAVMNPLDARLYVCNLALGRIEVINTFTDTALAPIHSALGPRSIGISPDGSRLFVGHLTGGGSFVNMVDIATDTVVDTVTGFGDPRRLQVNYNGSQVAVGDFGSDLLVKLNVVGDELLLGRVWDLNQLSPPGYRASPIGIGWSLFEFPVLEIRINGVFDVSITLSRSETANLSLTVYDSVVRTERADWWLMALRTGGGIDDVYYWSPFFWSKTPRPMYTGPITDVENFSSGPVSLASAPLGSFTFVLAVDVVPDGFLSPRGLYYTQMELVITE